MFMTQVHGINEESRVPLYFGKYPEHSKARDGTVIAAGPVDPICPKCDLRARERKA